MSIVNALISPVSELLGKFIEDKDAKAALAHEIATMAEVHSQAQVMAQLEVNKVEAAHKSLFVAGWRPAVGWICVLGLFYNVMLSPFLAIWFTMPVVESNILETTLWGMLGLGGLRTIEKVKNVQREQ